MLMASNCASDYDHHGRNDYLITTTISLTAEIRPGNGVGLFG